MASLSSERLRELAGFRAVHECAISLYVNLDPHVVPTTGDVAARVHAIIENGEHRVAASHADLNHAERRALRADFERLREYFASEFDRAGVLGAAVFAAGLENVWTPIELTEPVGDDVKVGRDFYVAPLVRLLGESDGAIVAVVGREQGRLYRLQAGRLEELAARFDEQPRRHDQGGWSQARYQRHIDELALGHLRLVADELGRQVRRLHAPEVVVVGAEETRAEFLELLPGDVRSSVVGTTQAEAHASRSELYQAAPVLDRVRAERERQSLERWREEAGRGGRAVAGWADTLEAASDGRVELLLFQDGADRPAYQCPACGRAAVTDGSCPLDGTAMEQRAEGVDLAVHQTLAHGGSVRAVRDGRDLEPVEGIGALLRY